MLWKWRKNASNAENDAYETPKFTYNRKLNLLISAISIIISDVEKESSPPYPKDAMTNSKEEITNLEEATPATTPHFTMGSNELNDPPMCLAQLNMSGIKSSNDSKIDNNWKA